MSHIQKKISYNGTEILFDAPVLVGETFQISSSNTSTEPGSLRLNPETGDFEWYSHQDTDWLGVKSLIESSASSGATYEATNLGDATGNFFVDSSDNIFKFRGLESTDTSVIITQLSETINISVSGGAQLPPTWPDVHPNERFRAAMDSTNLAFNDISGYDNHMSNVGVVTPRWSPSLYIGKLGSTLDANNQYQACVSTDFQQNSDWTVDIVMHCPIEGGQNIFEIANTNLTLPLGGVRAGGDSLQYWTGSSWVNFLMLENRYYNYASYQTWALTAQWGTDNVFRVWINGFQFLESGTLTPTTVVGNEALIRRGALYFFFRYLNSAPENPHLWHSKALFGA